ncbi:MAG: hypothetical protein HY558_04110 [Euryarchaeota archaeon]|nr:hypothetical protein [Euryarchaeota archaeon]
MKKIDLILLVSLLLVALLSAYLWANPEAGRLLSLGQWREWTESARDQSLPVALLITVGITMLGNLSPFPSPYILAVFFLSENAPSPLFPAFVAAVASIGALLGESVGYLIGVGIRRLATDSEKARQLQGMVNARPRLAYFLIFFMAITPLPDKVVMIPAGMAGFRFRYAILSMYLGKFLLLQGIAYGAYLYGRDLLRLLGPEESWHSGVATILLVILLIYGLLRVDLSRLARGGKKNKAGGA